VQHYGRARDSVEVWAIVLSNDKGERSRLHINRGGHTLLSSCDVRAFGVDGGRRDAAVQRGHLCDRSFTATGSALIACSSHLENAVRAAGGVLFLPWTSLTVAAADSWHLK
jgi:hypothetical protein